MPRSQTRRRRNSLPQIDHEKIRRYDRCVQQKKVEMESFLREFEEVSGANSQQGWRTFLRENRVLQERANHCVDIYDTMNEAEKADPNTKASSDEFNRLVDRINSLVARWNNQRRRFRHQPGSTSRRRRSPQSRNRLRNEQPDD